jgi:3-hydroxybutyryl-CoA dehydrogenase
MNPVFSRVAIIGAGAMGRGIAQIAAQAGSEVHLFDTQSGASSKAREAIGQTWDKLAEKGKLTAESVNLFKARLHDANRLMDLADCELVVEAIVEKIDIKKSVFADLEKTVAHDAVLVTNTSSLSVTAIAAGMQHPGRFAGYHFFNPVPLMKVVEVIAGLRTDAAVCHRLSDYARQMGHTPVQAGDTPGFIVNHAGRGYSTEALRIVSEGIADFATIDRILRDQVGFRLGPFELFDLTALDVSHHVSTMTSRATAPTSSLPSAWLAEWSVKRSARAFTNTSMACSKCPQKRPFRWCRICPPYGYRLALRGVPNCFSCSRIWAPE